MTAALPTRRAFLRGLIRSGAALHVAPLLGAATALASPTGADATPSRSSRTRAAMAALADTVFPPDETAGGADAGFVDLLFDPEFYQALLGFDVPLGTAIRLVVADLDRRTRAHPSAARRFADADLPARTAILSAALEGRLGLVYEGLTGLVKLCYFGGQRSELGWQTIAYPGPADAYPGAPGPAPAPSLSDDGNPA